MELQEGLNISLEKLEDFCKTHTVVGPPIHVGEITLIPFIEVLFGVGTSGSADKDSVKGGGAVGIGARIAPSGVLVVKREEITLLPLRDKNSLEKVIEIIPEIMERLPKKGERRR